MRAFNIYIKWKMQIFEPIDRGNAADFTNGWIMSYFHVEMRKWSRYEWTFKFNLEWNTSLSAASPKL